MLSLIEWGKNIGYYFNSYLVCKLITIKLTMKINLNVFYKFKERVNVIWVTGMPLTGKIIFLSKNSLQICPSQNAVPIL